MPFPGVGIGVIRRLVGDPTDVVPGTGIGQFQGVGI